MYLHLAPDEKFIDQAWAAFERAAPGRNTFVVLGNGPLRHVRAFAPDRAELSQLLTRKRLASLAGYDAVFLHSLDPVARSVVFRAPPETNFAWIGWGYDYYHLLAPRQALLLPLTAGLESTRPATAPRRSESRYAGSVFERMRGMPARIAFHRERRRLQPGGRLEWAMLDRIAHFAPVLPGEYRRMVARHPGFRPAFASWNYRIDLDTAALLAGPDRRSPHILVGNSATPESNHADAFAWILDSGLQGDVLCPLSYGDPGYRDAVAALGSQLLGARFRPIFDFLDEDAYARLVASCSHMVMAHIRQQGLGNILLALQAGVRIVLRTDNPVHPFLAGLGIGVATFDGFSAADRDPPGDVEVSGHRERVRAFFGEENHHRRTLAFLDQCGRGATGAAARSGNAGVAQAGGR